MKWNLYPQQVNALIPFGESTKLKLGRFIFNESMFYSLFDGAQITNHFGDHLEFSAYAGALTFLEQSKEWHDDHRLMGLSTRIFNHNASLKWSLLNRQLDEQNQFLTSVQALKKNDWAIPTDLSLELRYLSDEQEIEKSHFEWHSYLGDRFDIAYYFKTDNPKLSLPQKKNLWYRLTSSSDVSTHGLIPNYQFNDNLNLSLILEQNKYEDGTRSEEGKRISPSLSWRKDLWQLTPSVDWVQSFGGKILSPSLEIERRLSELSKVSMLTEWSRYEKINRISGNAYLLRSTYKRYWNSDFMSAISMDVERNHYYAFDIRGMFYVTHFAY